MQLIFIAVLWYLIIVLSKEQRKDFMRFVGELYQTYKHRKALKNAINIYTRLYTDAYTDYTRGYYYGKIGALKAELKEVKYFAC